MDNLRCGPEHRRQCRAVERQCSCQDASRTSGSQSMYSLLCTTIMSLCTNGLRFHPQQTICNTALLVYSDENPRTSIRILRIVLRSKSSGTCHLFHSEAGTWCSLVAGLVSEVRMVFDYRCATKTSAPFSDSRKDILQPRARESNAQQLSSV